MECSPVSNGSADTDILDQCRYMNDRPQLHSNKKRCGVCNMKLSIMDIECRCNHVFCGNHRLPYQHNCSINVKELHGTQLKLKNPVIKAQNDKIKI